jgi:hypothetical protein
VTTHGFSYFAPGQAVPPTPLPMPQYAIWLLGGLLIGVAAVRARKRMRATRTFGDEKC